jgi:hypothetical protein
MKRPEFRIQHPIPAEISNLESEILNLPTGARMKGQSLNPES